MSSVAQNRARWHREIKNTMLYTVIECTIFGLGADDLLTVRVAEKPEDIKALLETGSEYVYQRAYELILGLASELTA